MIEVLHSTKDKIQPTHPGYRGTGVVLDSRTKTQHVTRKQKVDQLSDVDHVPTSTHSSHKMEETRAGSLHLFTNKASLNTRRTIRTYEVFQIVPELMVCVFIPRVWKRDILHRGFLWNYQSILGYELIQVGKEKDKDRPAVFLTPTNPFGNDPEEEPHNDYTVPQKVLSYLVGKTTKMLYIAYDYQKRRIKD